MVLVSFLFSVNLFLVSGVSAQQAIELSRSSYSGPIANGPSTASQTVSFGENTTANNFVNLGNPVLVTASFSNQQFNNLPGNMNTGLAFGVQSDDARNTANVTSRPVFGPMNIIASPGNGSFTSSPYVNAGTGIDVGTNYGFDFFASASNWVGSSIPAGRRAYFGDIVFTFSRPVTDPVMQLVGSGTYSFWSANGSAPYDSNYMATEFELPANSGLTLTKLSGDDELSIPASADQILNNAETPHVACGDGAACGSIRINGTNITSLTFRVYMRFKNTGFQPAFRGGVPGDRFVIGFSATAFNLSGTIYNDANGLTDNTVNGSPTNAGGGLYAVSVDANNIIQDIASVTPAGAFSFQDLFRGNYTTKLTTNAGVVIGGTAPSASLPAGWFNTGENVGAGAGSDGTADGNLAAAINTNNVINVNMGIERAPVAFNIVYNLPFLPAVNSSVTLNGDIGGSTTGNTPIRPNGNDAEDGALSAGKDLVINTPPVNGLLRYNNIPVAAGQLISNFDPNLMTVQFTGSGYNSVSFLYSYRDAAGVVSAPAIYRIVFPNGTLLPVVLTGFTATISNNNSKDVVLNWQTSSELNNRGFAVQHSTDGREWEIIAFVEATGNGRDVTGYEYIHRSVSKGIHYYRLQQEDFTGASTLSYIRKVNSDDVSAIQVYPNPAANTLHILSGQKDLKELSLLDMAGKKIIGRQLSQRQYSLDVSIIPAGIYLLVIQYGDEEIVYEKIVKQ